MFAALRNWTKGELITLPRDFVSALLMPTPQGAFSQVKTFCVFLGHSRSGHSLLASLLDAHKNIVIADDPARFAAAVASLLGDRARGASIGEAGYRTVRKHYSWEQLTDRLVQSYTSFGRGGGTDSDAPA